MNREFSEVVYGGHDTVSTFSMEEYMQQKTSVITFQDVEEIASCFKLIHKIKSLFGSYYYIFEQPNFERMSCWGKISSYLNVLPSSITRIEPQINEASIPETTTLMLYLLVPQLKEVKTKEKTTFVKIGQVTENHVKYTSYERRWQYWREPDHGYGGGYTADGVERVYVAYQPKSTS